MNTTDPYLEAIRRLVETVGVILAAWWAYRAKVHSREGRDAATNAAASASDAATQSKPNSGSTMRDAVGRTEADVQTALAKLDGLGKLARSQGHQIGELRRDYTAAVLRHDADVTHLRNEITEARRDRRHTKDTT